jgi:hypothetical protein
MRGGPSGRAGLPIIGRMCNVFSSSSILMKRNLHLLRNEPNTFSLWPALFLNLSIKDDQVNRVPIFTPPPDNGLCWPNGLAPWKFVLVGAWRCAYRPLRKTSRCSSRRWFLLPLSRHSTSLRYDPRQLTNSTGWWDVAIVCRLTPGICVNFTWNTLEFSRAPNTSRSVAKIRIKFRILQHVLWSKTSAAGPIIDSAVRHRQHILFPCLYSML